MTGLFLIFVFVILALAMYSGKLPALLALPILAYLLTVVAGIPYFFENFPAEGHSFPVKLAKAFLDSQHLFFNVVVPLGVPRLHIAIMTVIIGGIFGFFLKLTGTSESLVRKIAELAGDNPFVISFILTIVVSFLFTTLSGLGAIILVANIYFPILLSLGLPPLLVGCLFLMSLSLGGVFNITNWVLYKDILGLSQDKILHYAISLGLISFHALFVFLMVEFKKARLSLPFGTIFKSIVIGLILLLGGAYFYRNFSPNPIVTSYFKTVYKLLLAALLVGPVINKKLAWISMLAPVVPISLAVILGWDIFSAFMFGILFLFATNIELNSESISSRTKMLIQSGIEGIQGVSPAIALMIGIGIVLIAVNQPPVSQSLTPILNAVLPSTKLGFVLFFTVFAPLSLYRGPLSIWGMGSGLMSLIRASKLANGLPLLTDGQILAAFMATGQMQGVCDPTNTHNVWVANQLKIELHSILAKTLPYMWAVALLGLIFGSYAG